MSAYLCSPQHIQLIVAYALHERAVREESGASLATILAAENIKSVEYRYPDTQGRAAQDFLSLESNEEYLQACAFPWLDTPLPINRCGIKPKRPVIVEVRKPLDIIKLCHGYEYQSCEHDGWETSQAREYLNRIIKSACRNLPGYDDAPWSM